MPPSVGPVGDVYAAKSAPTAETPEVDALKTLLGTISVSGDMVTVTKTPEGVKALDTLMKSLETPSDDMDAALVSFMETTYPGVYDKIVKTQGGGRGRQRGGVIDKVLFFKLLIGTVIALVFFGYLYTSVSNAQAAYDLVQQKWGNAAGPICFSGVKMPLSAASATGAPNVVAETQTSLDAAEKSACAAVNAVYAPLAANAVNTLNNAYSTARLSLGSAVAALLFLIGYSTEQGAALISIVAFAFTGRTPSPKELETASVMMNAWGKKSPEEAEQAAINEQFDADLSLRDAKSALEDAKRALAKKEADAKKAHTEAVAAAEKEGRPAPEEPKVDTKAEVLAVREAERLVKLAEATKKAKDLRLKNAQAALTASGSAEREGDGEGSSSAAAGPSRTTTGPRSRGRASSPSGDSTASAFNTKGKRTGGKTRGKKSKRRVTRRKIKFAY